MTQTPYSEYDAPSDVVTDDTLSTSRKLEILEKWKLDEEALQRAASEGLNGGVQSKLGAVQDAIHAVEDSDVSDTTDNAPLKTSLVDADLEPIKDQVKGIFGTNPG